MLSVKIKNTGDSAYQNDVYGDSIIVERHFSRSGSSSFKLKSSTGRMISTRKGDLDDICDYFALQIDNPMNVLTQDMARQFLNNSTPHEKYKFFMKGTQLEHLDGDYIIVENNLETIDQDLWKKMEDVKVFEERAEKARHLLSLSEKQDRLRERIDHLGHMIAWSQVEEQEHELSDCNRKMSMTDEKIELAELKAESLGEALRQTEQTSEHAKGGLEEATGALAPLVEEKDVVKREHDRHKAEQLALHVIPPLLMSNFSLILCHRRSSAKFLERSKPQKIESRRLKGPSRMNISYLATQMAGPMPCDAQKSKRREKSLKLQRLDSESMRTDFLLWRTTEIELLRVIRCLKTPPGANDWISSQLKSV